MITAGVFIYIIIITALPRGAGGEMKDRGGRREKSVFLLRTGFIRDRNV